MNTLYGVGVWLAVCNRLTHGRRGDAGTHLVTPFEMGRVLIAADQMHVLDALQMLLSGRGLATEAVTHPGRVLRALETGQFDAVLRDLNSTHDDIAVGEGLELVSQIRSMDSLLPVVVMTAWSSVDLAVEAMRRGASDFIQKPWENQDLLQKLQTNYRGHGHRGGRNGSATKNCGRPARFRIACCPRNCPNWRAMRWSP
jgi:DNA-binding NtrC family response regulator